MNKQVSILGCGWLGLPLAKHLIGLGWRVKGSTTSTTKLDKLSAAGIIAHKIELDENQILGDIQEFLDGSELLIINIPPGLRKKPESDFVAKMKLLISSVKLSEIKDIIYISSTGVFHDHESMPGFSEHYKFASTEVQQSQLIQAEQLLLHEKSLRITILRFGGLIGNDRHPVKYLSGKTDLKDPEAPVNLIHLDNCILLISEIIRQQKFGMVFHGVEDMQLTKEDYYSQKAKDKHLPAPEFNHDSVSKGKRIHMEWTAKELEINIPKKV